MKRLINTMVSLFAVTLLIVQGANADTVVPSDRVVSCVNVRAEAKRNADVVGSLAPGESAEHLDSVSHWYKVKLSDDTEGFVSKVWSRRISNTTQQLEGLKKQIEPNGATESIKTLKQGIYNVEKYISEQDINKRIIALENKFNNIEVEDIKNLKKEISKKELEIQAAKYLSEISNINLKYPKYVVSILALVVVILFGCLGGVGWWFINTNVDKIDKEIRRLENLNVTMTMNFFRRLAANTNNRAVDNFYRKRIDEAIKQGEASIKHQKKAKEINKLRLEETKKPKDLIGFFKEPDEEETKYRDVLYRSNLAFYFAKIKLAGMAKRSIRFAKLGLEEGVRSKNIDLIDNYLYILMNFADVVKGGDIRTAKRIYKDYKDEIEKSQVIPFSQKVKYAIFYGGLEEEKIWVHGMGYVFSKS